MPADFSSAYTGFAKLEQHYCGFIVVVDISEKEIPGHFLTLPFLRAPMSIPLSYHKDRLSPQLPIRPLTLIKSKIAGFPLLKKLKIRPVSFESKFVILLFDKGTEVCFAMRRFWAVTWNQQGHDPLKHREQQCVPVSAPCKP